MITLSQSLAAWGDSRFAEQFKDEVEALPAEQLPLQQGLSLSSYVSAEPFKVIVINSGETAGEIQVKAGVFYTGIIAGCSCADDPSPTDVQPEYCELQFEIDKASGAARLTLL